ncbi:MAG: shikimate kinase, partial [Desulfatiglandales bacterium]
PQYVIAPGGGAVLNADNVVNLKRKSRVFWLQADAATLLERMKDDPLSPSRRPPLTGLSPEKEVERLLQEREPFYKEASDTIIDTQDSSIREVVEEILSALEA